MSSHDDTVEQLIGYAEAAIRCAKRLDTETEDHRWTWILGLARKLKGEVEIQREREKGNARAGR